MITKEELLEEVDNVPIGWSELMHKMIDELYEEIVKSNLENYQIDQVKEKFGSLRWYDSGGNETTDEIIDRYSGITEEICAYCGKPATGYNTGWITYVCDEHKRSKND